mgnify:CR=1 FL=1
MENLGSDRKRILIVDDDETIRSGLSELLTRHGYEVHTAQDTNSALVMWERVDVDLVITDILMPGESGLSLIQAIRDYDTSIRIIGISGGGRNKGAGLLKVAKKMGADQVLQKPISAAEIIDTVKVALYPECNQ